MSYQIKKEGTSSENTSYLSKLKENALSYIAKGSLVGFAGLHSTTHLIPLLYVNGNGQGHPQHGEEHLSLVEQMTHSPVLSGIFSIGLLSYMGYEAFRHNKQKKENQKIGQEMESLYTQNKELEQQLLAYQTQELEPIKTQNNPVSYSNMQTLEKRIN